MTIIDLELYRDRQLLVESCPVKNLPGVVKWTITGEDFDIVNRAVDGLLSAAFKAHFTIPATVDDGPRHGWYRSVGFTVEPIERYR